MLDAAEVLPNMKLEVRLSAPVVFDTEDDPANMIFVVM
jgi:hypothetical protein